MKRSVLSTVVVAAVALAVPRVASPEQGQSAAALRTEEIPYVSGGVGKDARDELQRVARDYDLKLTFSEGPHRGYISDVRVQIFNQSGQPLLEAVSDGPWFLARLPEGKYRVVAVAESRSIDRQVQVGGDRLAELNFHWD